MFIKLLNLHFCHHVLRQLLRKVCHTTAVLKAPSYQCRDVFGSIHCSSNTHTHVLYRNQYMDQRSPALQQCHSFSTLYANTARVQSQRQAGDCCWRLSQLYQKTTIQRTENKGLLSCDGGFSSLFLVCC